MGNSYQTDKNLNIFIQTQKPYYNSGSSIQGTVFVQAFTNFSFDALYLRIQGNQWCQWFQGSSKNRRKYTGSQNFYVVEHILHKYDQQLFQQGKYAYPFSLQLSDNIPGSFQSQQHNAKIQYNLIAYFVNYKHPQKTRVCQKSIMIRQPFRQDIVKYTGEAISEPKKFGFISCGEIKLQVNFDRNVAYQGEDIEIKADINNIKGLNDMHLIKAELVEYTFVSSNGNASRTYRKVINTKKIIEEIKKGNERSVQFLFKIPSVEYQTAISTLVANYYRIEVSTDLGLGSSKNPCIYAPIFVLQKNIQLKGEQKQKIDFGQNFHLQKPVCIRSGEYLFKKNRNLDIFNFRNEDLVTQSVFGSENTFS